jgi:hypothetical protein
LMGTMWSSSCQAEGLMGHDGMWRVSEVEVGARERTRNQTANGSAQKVVGDSQVPSPWRRGFKRKGKL